MDSHQGSNFRGTTDTNGVSAYLENENGQQIYCYGTAANLPAAGANFSIGCIYRATDTGQLFTNMGTTTSSLFMPLNGGFASYPTKAAINSTGTATGAQIATGYITSTSGAATTITLPTGTLLGIALGATQGTTFDFYVDNTAGANTVTIAVAVNGILSAAAAAGSTANFGLLTVPSGVTGLARFTVMFSSATAYVFSRTA